MGSRSLRHLDFVEYLLVRAYQLCGTEARALHFIRAWFEFTILVAEFLEMRLLLIFKEKLQIVILLVSIFNP